MSFLGFIGQIVPWARQRAADAGGFGSMLARLAPWRQRSLAEPAPASEGGEAPPISGPPGTGDTSLPNEDWLRSATWIYPASSNVEAFRYLWDEQILEVEFKNGYFYQYYSVPPQTPSDFYYATSPGRFVWQRLRDRYPYARITSISSPKGTKPKPPSVVRTPTPKELATKWRGVKPTSGILAPWQKKPWS